MANEPFNKYFLVNFNEDIDEQAFLQVAGTPRALWRVWCCDWNAEHLRSILVAWNSQRASTAAELTDEAATELLCDLIELTLICVQHNFTGDFEQLQAYSEVVAQAVPPDCEPFVRLMENGEELNPNVKLGELLVVAKEMLQCVQAKWPKSVYLLWWHLRLICLQQQLLDELASNLYEQFKATADLLIEQKAAFMDEELEALLYLELANGYLQFHRTQKSEQLLQELCQRLQVSLNVEGLFGVRTKFQQKALPQLCLKVTQALAGQLPAAVITNAGTVLPALLPHEDDTRLERIRFTEPADNEVMTLPSVLQALVLAKVKTLKRAQPKDRLADEELEPYIQTLLYQQHGPLQVRQSALLLNCIQESGQRRTVERSWKQCEGVVKLLSEPNSKYALPQRLSYAFVGHLQPKWQLQAQLCELLLSLGMTKSALDIYLELQAWPAVIDCYTRLELRHKAAEIIRQELQRKPTVLLHCLLGDATDDPACYETAWEYSKHSSGKAQAHWGNYYYQRREYEAAIPHLELSVQINPLQEKIWLRLGYAAITLERWQLAVHAYITYTHLEPLGFESWNNLAKALVKLGDKKRAHKLLSESLKCNYTNWKVWENFMLVAVDTGNFEDALNAYSRLSELKERFIDLEVLNITVHAIAEDKPDAKGQSAGRLLKKATALLGQQCVKFGNEPQVWELAVLLAPTPLNKAQKLVKAYRAYTNKESAWTSQQQHALKALQLCNDMCTCAMAAVAAHAAEESEAMVTSQLSSARLCAQGCVRALEKEALLLQEYEPALSEVRQLLEQLTELLKQRMSASCI